MQHLVQRCPLPVDFLLSALPNSSIATASAGDASHFLNSVEAAEQGGLSLGPKCDDAR